MTCQIYQICKCSLSQLYFIEELRNWLVSKGHIKIFVNEMIVSPDLLDTCIAFGKNEYCMRQFLKIHFASVMKKIALGNKIK